ncbi:MAG TPA: hypothetical protein VE594_06155 [Nitrososphaeraceae archaeon]|nr:hypothetical protein [Nitrososphaeraceae archaeon]
MSNLEEYFTKYRKDIVDFVEGKVRREVKVKGDIYDTIANILTKELPYGEGTDNAHAFLTNAVISSFWCGWFSQARSNARDSKFKPEYVERYKEAIDVAYKTGREYAQVRP